MNTIFFMNYAVAEIKALETKRYEAVKKPTKPDICDGKLQPRYK